MKLGVLDIGTNSIHIVIGEAGRDMSFEIMGRAKDMTRLGDGTLKSGVIAKDKFDRGVAVVKHFVQLARNRGVSKILGVATAAVREASNGGEFVERIRRETGVKVRTITGDEESRLIYLAVRHYADLSRGPALIVDIGGGSAEFIVGGDKELLFARSLKLGGARLKDLFLTDQPVPKSDHDRLHRHLRDALGPTLNELRKFPVTQAIGTSGTIINLGSVINAHRDGEPLTNPEGFSFSAEDLEEVHEELVKAGRGDLDKIKGIDPDRKDILLPGACLLSEVLEALDLDAVRLCDKAIREGVFLDYSAKNAKKLALEAEIPNARLRSVLQLANRCEFDEAHARQTAKLALSLFDQLAVPRGLPPATRELLEYAALLHDIGYHISFEAHHKHGWYLIKNSDLAGFTPEEVDMIACVARYHRKRGPKKKDAALTSLDRAQRASVELMAAIVRLADALDRSRFGLVESLKVAASGRKLLLKIRAKDDPAMEMWAARQKTGLLEEVLGRPIVIESLPVSSAARETRSEPAPVPKRVTS